MSNLRLRLAIAQIGFKPGRKKSLKILLDLADLDGSNWKKRSERTWRVGWLDSNHERASRARKQKCIAAWRFFVEKNRQQVFWVQLSPCASIEDAEAGVIHSRSNYLPNKRRKLRIKVDEDIVGASIEGIDNLLVFEQKTENTSGLSNCKAVIWNIDRFVLMAYCAGTNDGWLWNDVYLIVQLQNEKALSYLKITDPQS